MTRKEKLRELKAVAVFLVIFVIIFTALTLIFYPKWSPEESSNISSGIYLEEKNSIDVLFVGSCNMYTSVNPLFVYEHNGIASYSRSCPDQTLNTAYYQIKEALKNQNPKLIVVDSLYVGAKDSDERESFNREAVDYMKPSLLKFQMIKSVVNYEVECMRSFDPGSPGKLLTYAGYYFPLLRYHSRIDLSASDFTFFRDYTGFNYTKGAEPMFNYCNMDGLQYDTPDNTVELRKDAEEYIPKIIELCREKGIQLLFINTPNRYRWDAETTAAARKHIEEMGGKFADLYTEFSEMYKEYNYQYNNGRMNIYGMKKFSELIGDYIVDNYGLTPSKVSKEKLAEWEECINKIYEKAKEEGFSLYPGSIAQIKNEGSSIMLRWNACSDCNKYCVYRKGADDGDYKLIAVSCNNIYYDDSVKNGEHYYYYIVPCEGEYRDKQSEPADYVFVDKPEGVRASLSAGSISVVTDKAAQPDTSYFIQKRGYGGGFFFDFTETKDLCIKDSDISEDEIYFYRIRKCIEKDGTEYFSDSVVCKAEN